MAVHAAGTLNNNSIEGASLRYITLSGTVKDGLGNPLRRTITIYKNSQMDKPFTTESDESTGQWVIDIVGNHNDEFMAICLGNSDSENSEIYDHLKE